MFDFSHIISQTLNESYTIDTMDNNFIGFYLTVPTGGEISFYSSKDNINFASILIYNKNTDSYISSTTSNGDFHLSIDDKFFKLVTSSAGSADGFVKGFIKNSFKIRKTHKMPNLSIQKKNSYFLQGYLSSYLNVTNSSASVLQLIQPTTQNFINVTNGSIDSNFLLPSSNSTLYINSSSSNDTFAGTGLRECTIYYYNDSSSILQFSDISMNGTSDVEISTDVFRIQNVIPLSHGSSNFNAGLIQIVDSSGNIFPGNIPSFSNRWVTSVISTPKGIIDTSYNNSRLDRNLVIDSFNYQINNGTGNIYIFINKNNTYWQLYTYIESIGTHFNNNNILKNLLLNCAENSYDIVIGICKTSTLLDTIHINFNINWFIE